MMTSSAIIANWAERGEAHVTVSDPNGSHPNGSDLTRRLRDVVSGLVTAGATRLVVDPHRLAGDDTEVLEFPAVLRRRPRHRPGMEEVRRRRDRLVTRPEVRALPEFFGDMKAGS